MGQEKVQIQINAASLTESRSTSLHWCIGVSMPPLWMRSQDDEMSVATSVSSLFQKPSRDVVRVKVSYGPFIVSDINVEPQSTYEPVLQPIADDEVAISDLCVDHREAAGRLLLPAASSGSVERHGAQYSFEELLEEGHIAKSPSGQLALELELGDRIVAHCEKFCFMVERDTVASPGARIPGGDLWREHLGAVVAISFIAHALVLLASFMIPVQSHAVNMDHFDYAKTFARAHTVKPVVEVPTEVEVGEEAADESSGVETDEPAVKRPRQMQVRKPRIKKTRMAKDVGILKGLSGQKASIFNGDMKQMASRLGHGLHDGSREGLVAGMSNPFGDRLGRAEGGGSLSSIKGRDLREVEIGTPVPPTSSWARRERRRWLVACAPGRFGLWATSVRGSSAAASAATRPDFVTVTRVGSGQTPSSMVAWS